VNAESERYTSVLAGRTIREVEHFRYGSVYLHFTDGTKTEFTSSGSPPSIFLCTPGVPQTQDPLSGIRETGRREVLGR
jgi:hypothetical protein